jgi:hypothetical protein
MEFPEQYGLPRLGHHHFLQNPFKFIIHLSIWRYVEYLQRLKTTDKQMVSVQKAAQKSSFMRMKLKSSYCITIVLFYFIVVHAYMSIYFLVQARLWSSGQSLWLQIQKPRVRFPALPIFWEVGGLERVPLSLVRTIEEVSEWKSSGSGIENRD